MILFTGFIVSLFFNSFTSNAAFGVSLTLTLFTAGLLLYTQEKSSAQALDPEETDFYGCISEYPEEKEKTFSIILRLETGIIDGCQQERRGSILLYHRKYNACRSYKPGDKIVIRCRPQQITNRGNPYEFDYRLYMENRGIRYYAFTDSSDISYYSSPVKRKLTHRALIIREKIIDMFRERGLEGDRLALVAAITLGQKNMLEPEQKQFFIKAGVMHIMAVSGLHAVILSLFVFRLLFFLKGKLTILRVIITMILLWSFAFVTGLTPSVLRATLMFTFLQAGNIMKRPVNPVNSVLASAFVLILARPSVIFDAGFLLSYSAVIFIIGFYRDFYLKIRFTHRLPDLVWQMAAVSIIAQAGTLPLTVMLFNRFPTWFILSNIIIVPLSSLVIILGCLVPLTFPLEFISKPLAIALDFLTGLTEDLTSRAAGLPLSTIDNIGMTIGSCVLFTAVIFLSLRFLLVKKSIPVHWPLAAILILTIAGTFSDISLRRSNEIIIYNSQYTTIGIRTGKILNVYSDSLPSGPEVRRHCATLGLRLSENLLTDEPLLIGVEDNRTFITNNLQFSILARYKPDIVIIRGRKPVCEKITQPIERLKAIIISSGANPRSRDTCMFRSLNADTIHFTGIDGGFRLKL